MDKYQQEDADGIFSVSLAHRDSVRLTREIRRRLDSCLCGTGVSFRTGEAAPFVWGGTTKGEGAPDHVQMSRDAAEALIANLPEKRDAADSTDPRD